MTNPDHPAGIIETMLESIEENNRRLNALESKIDRIWEIVAKLSSDFARIAKPSIRQLTLFEDEAVSVSIPDWQDREAYREYTSDLIFKLKNEGMNLDKRVQNSSWKPGCNCTLGRDPS